MTREIALHCMKSYSELHSDLCELCPIYGQTGSDHCFEDALQYVIGILEQEPREGHWDIKDNMWWICSACGCQTRMMKKYNVPRFCPACGADMRGENERNEYGRYDENYQ